MPNTNPSEDSETPQSRRARQPLPTQVDVAIIGAGLGGLMAAAHLTRAGLAVACFDAHYVAGGCATHFQRGGRSARYRFDIGLHYIGDCGPDGSIPRLLREVGVTLDYAALDPEGFDTLLFPAKCGYHVVEMPISYNERVGASKLRKLAGTWWTFVRLARATRVGSRLTIELQRPLNSNDNKEDRDILIGTATNIIFAAYFSNNLVLILQVNDTVPVPAGFHNYFLIKLQQFIKLGIKVCSVSENNYLPADLWHHFKNPLCSYINLVNHGHEKRI